MLKLTSDNYYSQEANMEYMSASQFKAFQSCEAAALAELKGEYEREMTAALLVGSYVDAFFEGKINQFRVLHPEIFTKAGTLKSEYIQAEKIINRVQQDAEFMRYMAGEKQVIMTAELEGIPFKIKIDSYHAGQMIVDLKCMKDFEPVYVKGKGRQNFILAWGYDIQGAIYQKVEKNRLPFYIAAATKEKVTDIDVFEIPQEYLDLAYENVRQYAMRYQAIKQGIITPVRCEKCDYCKITKRITSAKNMEELDYE